jgi:CRP-like cAMP-binding protein
MRKPATNHRANRLLAALGAEDFQYLVPHLEIVNLHQGQVLYGAGEDIRYNYFPHDTIVALVAIMKDGRSAEMALSGREGVAGLVNTAVTRQSFGHFVVQRTGTASRISVDRMHEAISTRPNIHQLIQLFTEATMSRILQNVACNAVHSVEARCCRWILSTHDWVDDNTLPLSHTFLADMLGVQRSTVSTVTRALQTAGLIRQGRGVITVVDRAGLEAATCKCYSTVRQRFEYLLPHTYMKVRSHAPEPCI